MICNGGSTSDDETINYSWTEHNFFIHTCFGIKTTDFLPPTGPKRAAQFFYYFTCSFVDTVTSQVSHNYSNFLFPQKTKFGIMNYKCINFLLPQKEDNLSKVPHLEWPNLPAEKKFSAKQLLECQVHKQNPFPIHQRPSWASLRYHDHCHKWHQWPYHLFGQHVSIPC